MDSDLECAPSTQAFSEAALELPLAPFFGQGLVPCWDWGSQAILAGTDKFQSLTNFGHCLAITENPRSSHLSKICSARAWSASVWITPTLGCRFPFFYFFFFFELWCEYKGEKGLPSCAGHGITFSTAKRTWMTVNQSWNGNLTEKKL